MVRKQGWKYAKINALAKIVKHLYSLQYFWIKYVPQWLVLNICVLTYQRTILFFHEPYDYYQAL